MLHSCYSGSNINRTPQRLPNAVLCSTRDRMTNILASITPTSAAQTVTRPTRPWRMLSHYRIETFWFSEVMGFLTTYTLVTYCNAWRDSKESPLYSARRRGAHCWVPSWPRNAWQREHWKCRRTPSTWVHSQKGQLRLIRRWWEERRMTSQLSLPRL